MSRIAERFRALAEQGKTALIPYVVAGDPHPDITVDLLHRLAAAGADIIEIGVPFSDPMSEGPVIQLGHERALVHHVSLKRVLAMVQEFRQRDSSTPLLLMGYANPIEHMGHAAFVAAAKAAGVDAILTVDIPPEEVADLNVELKRAGMDNIFLVAPTTPPERVAHIAENASGFIYYVSLKGVTGAGHLDTEDVARHVAEIKGYSDLPVAVGFGIKDAATAARVAAVSDGVIVGSALVACMAEAVEAGAQPAEACVAAAELVAEIRAAIDNAAS